jgi:YD repeat-containing protein
MRRVLSATILLLACSLLPGNGSGRSYPPPDLDVKTSWEDFGLRGKVKSRVESPLPAPVLSLRQNYDAKGRLVSEEAGTLDSLHFRSSYEYDASGRLTRSLTVYHPGSAAGSEVEVTYEYDENGYVMAELETRTPGGKLTRAYGYSAKGYVREWLDTTGGQERLYLMENHDSRGRITSRLCVNLEGYIAERAEYTYIPDRNAVMTVESKPDGKAISRELATRDSLGRLLESYEYGPAGDTLRVSRYSYDDKGSLVECRQRDMLSGVETLLLYGYEYDQQGNAISIRESRNGEVVGERRVVLEYY